MPDERTVSFVDQQGVSITVRVAPRSTFSIFQYLGRLVAEGEAGLIKLKTEAATGRPPLFDDNFFLVQSGGAGGPCFLAVNYEGRNYCVPTEDARNTKRILGLLVQLLALSTEVRDISNVGPSAGDRTIGAPGRGSGARSELQRILQFAEPIQLVLS